MSTKNGPPKKLCNKKQKQGNRSSPRSPLKLRDSNTSQSSFSSSTISSEGPTGCLRFFLSSATPSKHANISKPKCNFVSKTPKSAPNLLKKRNDLRKGEKPDCRNVNKAPNPGLCSWKSGRKFRSRYELSDGGNEVNLSGNGPSLGSVRENSSRCDISGEVKLSENGADLRSTRKNSSRHDLSDELKLSENGEDLRSVRKNCSRYKIFDGVKSSANGADFTPVRKWGGGSDLEGFSRDGIVGNANGFDASRSPTPPPPPPVQSSVSPEIQGGSMSVMAGTPTTCYAAGHVMSGVSDKRKCRPRGLLTIGDNDLFGSSRNKGVLFEDGSVVETPKTGRDSIVPTPSKASVQWLLSPCDENMSEGRDDAANDDTSGFRLDQCKKLIPFKSIACSSSPSSSLGFSSELFNKSDSTISSSGATTNSSKRSRSNVLQSDSSSDFRGVLGPSFDHLVRSSSPSSPGSSSGCKFGSSPEQGNYSSDHLEDSVGSGNVIQTPDSTSSPSNPGQSYLSPRSNSRSPNQGLSHLSRDEISRLWFECELDSVTEVLRRVSLSPECQMQTVDSSTSSFEFNPLIIPGSSIDLTLLQKVMDCHTNSEIPESVLPNSPEREVRISWREGLASRIFEMDELDCCRCLSDDEDDGNGSVDTFEPCINPEISASGLVQTSREECGHSPLLRHDDNTISKHKGIRTSDESRSCLESTHDGEGPGHAEEDTSWTVSLPSEKARITP